MNKSSQFLLLIVVFCLSTSASDAQDFRIWGTGSMGEGGYGTIYSIRPNDQHLIVPKTFYGNPEGSNPIGKLTEGTDGDLYGVNTQGGSKRQGSVFKIKRDGTGYTVLYAFEEENDGTNPSGALIAGPDDFLYGMTSAGGIFSRGIIFKVKTDGTGYRILHAFNGPEGSQPQGSLMLATDGSLYGLATQGGGEADAGLIFKIQTDGSGYTVLKNLDGTGRIPQGSLIEGSDGKLYGSTMGGSINDGGILFKINKDGSNFEKLWDFSGDSKGQFPTGYFSVDEEGSLYGMTRGGGASFLGIVFKVKNFTASNREFVKLFEFTNETGGQALEGLTFTSTGDLIGTLTGQGDSDWGCVFTLKTDGTNFTRLFSFDETKGLYQAGLLRGTDDQYYGTTLLGGKSNNGTVYKITLSGTHTILKDFEMGGMSGVAGLTRLSDGKLYGLSAGGGLYGHGTMFSIKIDGTEFTHLKDFNGRITGKLPMGSLLEATDGMLYGMTSEGGSAQGGTIFKIRKDGTGFVNMKNFSFSQGSHPKGSLIQVSATELMGVTYSGGVNSRGVLFKINLNGTGYTKIIEFEQSTSGAYPYDIQKGADGFIYGLCSTGGAYGKGTLFKVQLNGSQFTKLMDFDGSNTGSSPRGKLMQTANGYLFGFTSYGGVNNCGTLFKIKPDGTGYVKLKDFGASAGSYIPEYGSLSLGPDGNLYGTTYSGGALMEGVIYRIDQEGGNFTNVYNFSKKSGNYPASSNLIFTTTQPQSISFELPEQILFDGASFETIATATTTSGLPVTYESDSWLILDIEDSVAEFRSPGRVTITARQEGSLVFSAAAPVEQTVCIVPTKPLIDREGNTLVSSSATGNQWYLNDVVIEGATGSAYDVTEPGNYTVRVTADDCVSEFSEIFTIETITGIEKDLSRLIHVYPNPAQDQIQIDFKERANIVHLTIYDFLGSVKMVNPVDTPGKILVDVRNYPSGNYIVKLELEHQVVYKKFVKR